MADATTSATHEVEKPANTGPTLQAAPVGEVIPSWEADLMELVSSCSGPNGSTTVGL